MRSDFADWLKMKIKINPSSPKATDGQENKFMEKELIVKLHRSFEDCAHEKNGVEFWYARELQGLLGYEKWDNFEKVIDKAKIACENADQNIFDHFADVGKTIPMPKLLGARSSQ